MAVTNSERLRKIRNNEYEEEQYGSSSGDSGLSNSERMRKLRGTVNTDTVDADTLKKWNAAKQIVRNNSIKSASEDKAYNPDSAFDKYKPIMESDDFEETSQYKSTIENRKFLWMDDRFIGDDVYEYINNADGKIRGDLLADHDKNQANTYLYKPSKYVEMGLDQLTEDEVKVFNSIYAKEGKEAAYEFLEEMKPALTKRASGKNTELVEEFTDKGGLQAGVASALSPFLNIGGGIYSGLDSIDKMLSGEQKDPYSVYDGLTNMASDIRQSVSADIEEGTEGMDLPIIGNVPSFLYNTGMSMADSIVGLTSIGKAFTPILGMNAYQQKTKELTEAGAAKDEIFWTSLVSGVAEAGFEYAGIDRLFKIKNTDEARKIFKNALKQAGVEGLEEVGTEVVNITADTLIRGNNSELMEKYNHLLELGYTKGEAQIEIAKEFGSRVAQAGIGGALSGGVMGGVYSGAQYSNYKAINKQNEIESPDEQDETLTPDETEILEAYTEYAGVEQGETTEPVKIDETIDLTESQAEDLSAYTQGMSKEKAELFKAQYDGQSDIEAYANSFDLAYTYGETGFGTDSVLKNKGVLSDKQATEIYKSAMINKSNAQQKAIDEINTKHGKNVTVAGAFNDSIIDYNNATTDNSKVNWNSLTSTQRDVVTFAKGFSKATGVNVTFVKSDVINGKRVGKNGSYDPVTNTIELDVYAGIIDEKSVRDSIVPTMSHEMTHWMKAKAPAMYRKMQEHIFNTLALDGKFTSEERVAAEIARIKKNHPDMEVTDEMAIDEIVARGCEDMLSNSEKARELLNGMSETERKTFIDKVKEIFKNLTEWVDELLSKYKSNSNEAKVLRQYQNRVNELSKMWDQALAEAIKTNQSLQSAGVTGEQVLKETGITQLSDRDSEGNKLSEQQVEFFKDSKARDEDGDLQVVYHGTVREFYAFDREYANAEGNMGKGFYFTNDPSDVESNYANEDGPDLKNKIEREADILEGQEEYEDMDHDEIVEKLREKYITAEEPITLEVYLNIKNPVYVGEYNGKRETILLDDVTEEYDYDDYEDEDEYYYALEDATAEYIDDVLIELRKEGYYDQEEAVSAVLYEAISEGGITFEDLKKRLNEQYLEDEEGNLVGNEVARIVVEALGYDGIIDTTVSEKFKNMGLSPDSTHYIVFNSNQAKLTTNTTPTSNEDIRYSDREYLQAVENGDLETAQKMVDKMAETWSNGDEVYAMDPETGEAIFKFYRSADGGRTIWNTHGNNQAQGVFLTSDEHIANAFDPRGKHITVYAKAKKPFKIDAKGEIYAGIPIDEKAPKWLRDVASYDVTFDEKVNDYVEQLSADIDNLYPAAFKKGYDALIVSNVREGVGGGVATDVVLKDGGVQMKSAEPVVYDDNGNVIPLSKRFNSRNADIRYSDRENTPSAAELLGENKRLKKQIQTIKEDMARLRERLRLEKKITGGNVFDRNQLQGFAKYLLKTNASTYDAKALESELDETYTFMADNLAKGAGSEDATIVKCMDVARSILDKKKPEKTVNNYYKEILSDIHKTRISLSDVQIQEAKNAYGKRYRDAFMGRVILAKDGMDLDSKWQTWAEMYPDIFDAEITEGNQITELHDICVTLKEASEIYDDYVSEEEVTELAVEIYSKYWTLSRITTTADKYSEQIKELNLEHRKAMKELREEYKQRIADQEKADAIYYGRIVNNLRQKNKAEVARVKALGKQRMDEYKDRVARKNKIQRITKNALTLNRWLTKNSKDEHIPEVMKEPVAYLLNAIDFSSKQLLGMYGEDKAFSQTNRDVSLSRALEQVHNMVHTIDSAQIGDNDIAEIYGTFADFPVGFADDIKELSGNVNDIMRSVGDNAYVLNQMSLEQLEELDKIVATIKATATKMNKFLAIRHAEGVADLSKKSITYMDELGKAKVHEGLRGKVDKMIDWGNALPYYTFKRFGEGGQMVYEALQDGWDKFTFHIKDIIDYSESVYNSKEVKEWGETIKEFSVLEPATEEEQADPNYEPKYQNIKMTVPQIMSLYCLTKREQAKNHLMGGGMRIADFEVKSKTVSQSEGVILNENEIGTIVNSLTDRQKAVADKLQEYMNTTCTDWGNEVSMIRFGYKAFGEENYFPIQSDKNNLAVNDETEQNNSLFRLLNMSFTKTTDKKANNRIVVSNIFDVFAQHSSDMAKYNALALPVIDAFKWYNYKEKVKKGETQFTTKSLKQSLESAFGKDGQNYIVTFLRDINGEKNTGRDSVGSKFFSNAKLASVALNIRVVALQPTSYVRASAVIDPKYLTKAFTRKPKIDKAQQYCGIAQWKALGFYDTDIQKGVAELIKHEKTKRDKAVGASLKGAEVADKVTWGYLWNACELEIRDKRKDLKVGSEGFNDAVAKRLRDIIYSTQVVDSTMTRSQMMRSNAMYDKMLTTFASEPTVAYNMLQDAYYDWKLTERKTGSKQKAFTKHGKKIARVFTAYTVTNMICALIEAGFDIFRDDEEEVTPEEFVEKYTKNFLSDMSILNKIPYAREVTSMLQGYSSSRTDTQWLQYITYTVNGIRKLLEGNGNAYTTAKNAMRAFSYATGLPIYNTWRDTIALLDKTGAVESKEVEAMFNDTIGSIYPSLKSK